MERQTGFLGVLPVMTLNRLDGSLAQRFPPGALGDQCAQADQLALLT